MVQHEWHEQQRVGWRYSHGGSTHLFEAKTMAGDEILRDSGKEVVSVAPKKIGARDQSIGEPQNKGGDANQDDLPMPSIKVRQAAGYPGPIGWCLRKGGLTH